MLICHNSYQNASEEMYLYTPSSTNGRGQRAHSARPHNGDTVRIFEMKLSKPFERERAVLDNVVGRKTGVPGASFRHCIVPSDQWPPCLSYKEAIIVVASLVLVLNSQAMNALSLLICAVRF